MRTLKKALCLVLVLSMLAGFGVIGAGAAYSDADQIEYQEAVDVMTAIGVMQGVGENTFDPDGTFTRAQAAKMLSYMILGETAAEALPARSDFTDVSADQWFSKYIGFGVSEGYIAGMGDGSFQPDAPVTGYQWAKMLLCALGYDPKTEGLEGNGYEINVAKLALTKVKLFEGNEGADYNLNATREEAALYAFNTLSGTMVEYDGKTIINIGGVEVEIGQGEAKPVTNASSSEGKIKTDGYMQFAEQYFPKLSVSVVSDDAYGRPANTWNYDGDKVGDYAKDADLVITSKVADLDALNKLLKGAGLKEAVGTESVVATNNKLESKAGHNDNGVISSIYGDWSGNGNVIELYADDNDVVKTVVVITPSFEEVSVVNYDATSKKGAYSSYTVNGQSGVVFSTVVDADADKDTAVVTGTVADGDKVLAYRDYDGILHISAITDSVTGLYTSLSSDNVMTIGGQTYKQAAAYDSTDVNINATEEQTFYVDPYGYILGVKEAVDTAAPNYIYITAVEAKGQTSDIVTSEAGYVAVQGYLADGSKVVKYLEVKTATKAEGNVDKDENYVTITNASGVATKIGLKDTDANVKDAVIKALNGTATTTLTNAVFTYTEKDAGISVKLTNGTITVGSDTYKSGKVASVTVQKNNANVTNITGLYANSQTKLVVVDTNGAVTTTTGYANFPSTAKTYTTNDIFYLAKGSIITDIIVIGDASTTTSDAVFAVGLGTTYQSTNSDGEVVTFYNFYINGETKSYTDGGSIANVKDTLYVLTPSSDGSATVTAITGNTEVEAVKSSYKYTTDTLESADFQTDYVIVNGNAIVLGDAPVYDLTGDSYAAGTMRKGDTVAVIYDVDNGANTLVVAYITARP